MSDMLTVLIIEDRAEIRAIWKLYLQRQKKLQFDFKEAETMRLGLILAEQFPPDLILLDMKLPDSLGDKTIHTIPYLKASNPHSIVILLSGYMTDQIAEAAINAGANQAAAKQHIETCATFWTIIGKALHVSSQTTQQKMQTLSEIVKDMTAKIK